MLLHIDEYLPADNSCFRYTYGAYVKGEATIKVKPQYTFYKEDTKENVKLIKVDTVGQTVIDIVDVLGWVFSLTSFPTYIL